MVIDMVVYCGVDLGFVWVYKGLLLFGLYVLFVGGLVVVGLMIFVVFGLLCEEKKLLVECLE